MNDREAVRVRTLLSALVAMLNCAQEVEEDSTQIASALFLCAELGDALDRMTGTLAFGVVARPANET
jgi:hypothetical protein